MKLGFYDDFRPCLLKQDGVVDISRAVRSLQGGSPQLLLENIIANFSFLRPKLERLEERERVIPLGEVRLRQPVPRPGKILCGRANYREGLADTPRRPMGLFFKSSDAVIGPGDAVVLPPFQARIFHHEAELCAVMGKEAKNVPAARAMEYVFGYTCGVDVSARSPAVGEMSRPAIQGNGPALPGNFGKSFDTFNPIGPAISTADAIRDPHRLQVKFWINGDLRQDYNTSDMEHQIPAMIEAISAIMTLRPGDLIMCGTNHQGLGPLQDGDTAEIEVEGIGRCTNPVVDPLKRTWPRGVDRDMGRVVREMRTAPVA
jgi:2-keto-4-pentenoate hydratase/2-oxohepta-3-ene-1,7-dioic acid hydratase in catechol pathway